MTDDAIGVTPFDLAPPVRTLVPMVSPLLRSDAFRARAERERREREARVAEAVASAAEAWNALRMWFVEAGVRIGVAVLDLHQPVAGYDRVVCSECLTDENYEATAEAWPCATYLALGGAR